MSASVTQSLFITQGRGIGHKHYLNKVNPLVNVGAEWKDIFAINYWMFSINISLKIAIWGEKKEHKIRI